MKYMKGLVVIILMVLFQNVTGDAQFRILAPPFVCPKDENAVIAIPDYTVITMQPEAGSTVEFSWTVRWVSLPAPTQRATIMLWRSVRKLEASLNGPQVEPNVYFINNTELLPGVKYTFNVTGTASSKDEGTLKTFHIDNIDGDQKLLIEGRSDLFAVMLIGSQVVYPDMGYLVQAQVTSCYRTQDYYFIWTIGLLDSEDKIDIANVKGSRLEIPGNTLQPGLYYNILCKVQRYSTQELITQASMTFRTLHRDLIVFLSVDVLLITVDKPFNLIADTNQIENLTITWNCVLGEQEFGGFEADDTGTISFPSGLPKLGEYLVSVSVRVAGYSEVAKASARIITVGIRVPILQLDPIPWIINEDTTITLSANVSDAFPGCTITWYFASKECLSTEPESSSTSNTCSDKEGSPISVPFTFYSLEENFLNELADYSNEMEEIRLTTDLKAADGRVRLVAECGCSHSSNCSEKSVAYAEVNLAMNRKPGATEIKISPERGTTLETIFRLSTTPSSESDSFLRYSFYCDLGTNGTLLLGSHLDYLAVETFLPYTDGGTTVWIEVCDTLGACSKGIPKQIDVSPGDACTLSVLIEDAQAHVKRCEMMMLQRLVVSAIVTYTNAVQLEALSNLTAALPEILNDLYTFCMEDYREQYRSFLEILTTIGVDVTMNIT